MRFCKRKKKTAAVPMAGGKRSSSGKRYPVEVKLLAARAKEAGLNRAEVSQLVGASQHSIDKWYHVCRPHWAGQEKPLQTSDLVGVSEKARLSVATGY